MHESHRKFECYFHLKKRRFFYICGTVIDFSFLLEMCTLRFIFAACMFFCVRLKFTIKLTKLTGEMEFLTKRCLIFLPHLEHFIRLKRKSEQTKKEK